MRHLFIFLLLLTECLWAQDENRIFYQHWHIVARELPLSQSVMPTDRLGASATCIGDLDQDGFQEVVVGQVGADESPGSLVIVSLDPLGEVQQLRRIERPLGLGAVYDWKGNWGQQVTSIGDWDGDGIHDIAVSEPKAKLGTLSYGILWLLTLYADGSLKAATPLHGRVAGLQGVVPPGQSFGRSVAAVGDVDGNGQVDLVVGAPGDANKHIGEVYLLLMTSPTQIRRAIPLSETSTTLQEELRLGDQWGFSLANVDDLDGNGFPELAIGAPRDGSNDEGAIYLVWLGKKGRIKRWKKLTADSEGLDLPLVADDRWGSALAHYKGLLPDGLTALATGVPLNDDGGKNRGAVYVLGLDKNGKVQEQHKISLTTRNFEGEFTGEYGWGGSLNPAGDLDRDGRPDLLVNGEQEDQQRGSFWVLRPTDWPERLKETLTWAKGAFQLTAADSARIYADANTAADSARIDSLYDLSGYAPTHLVLLLDVSASMNQANKLPLLREAFIGLLPFLRPEDRVSVITYSGKPTLQLAAVPAQERANIIQTLETLQSQGDTKPRKALEMAYELAEDQFIPSGNNRIIFATDGGFNASELDRPLDKYGSSRIPVSVFYFGKLASYQLDDLKRITLRGYGNLSQITSGSVTTALLREVKQIRRRE